MIINSPPIYTVELPPYQIQIGTGLLDRVASLAVQLAPAHRYAVITDSNVGPLYAQRIAEQFSRNNVEVFTFPAGEAFKTRETWANLTDQLMTAGFGRDSAVIAVGGGVVGDMAGFVASTYMRGIPVIQVPTTLLAMIDASIGGKTGVDTTAGKNLVGTFHPPEAVLSDPTVLTSLPKDELRSGLAEAVKHGVIADAAYFQSLKEVHVSPTQDSINGKSDHSLTDLIIGSVRIKARTVSEDEREGGIRKILNFGHTIGHAIELLSNFELPHGHAISIGMTLETRAAEKAGITEPGTSVEIAKMLKHFDLPTTLPASGKSAFNSARILEVMRTDKKGRSGLIEYAVPVRIGKMARGDGAYGVKIDDSIILEVLEN